MVRTVQKINYAKVKSNLCSESSEVTENCHCICLLILYQLMSLHKQVFVIMIGCRCAGLTTSLFFVTWNLLCVVTMMMLRLFYFKLVSDGDVSAVDQFLNQADNLRRLYEHAKCHPLCECPKCVRISPRWVFKELSFFAGFKFFFFFFAWTIVLLLAAARDI